MAVDAVASLVLQKLRDFLSDESFPTNTVISHQLKHMQKALEKKRGFLVDAAEKETDVNEITAWTNDYLRLLYSVEDSIELFAVRITRQRKRLGFVMDHALFLIKFTDLKMLIKLHRAQRKIKKLNSRTPSGLEDASLRGRSPRKINSGSGSVRPVDEDGDARKDNDDGTKEENSRECQELGSKTVCSPGDIVMMSYNDLDAHLKLCLLYMMLFPNELDIPVRRLQRLWLAEGFVKQPQNEEEFQEDVAQEYFDNLVRHSLIMVTKLRSDGSPRRCRLLGVLHDLLLAQARDISLFHVHFGPDCHIEGSLGKRRLIEYADAGNCPLEPSEIGRLRSYISFNLQKKDTPAKHVSSLVSRMVGKGLGLLRVLDLEGVYKPSLPENLGDLFHLRYLGLRWTFLDKLPKSVGELPYLETLDLKHTRIDKIPAAIWKLKNLRHLNLDEVHLDKDTLRHLHKSLPKLLTLWGLSVSHESPIKNGLSMLKHLRELGISFRLINCSHNTDESTKALVEWISELTALRSLRLRSKDDCGHPADLSLKPFSGLTKLSHMKLLGKLQQLPLVEHFPPHIKVLTLSLSYLGEDPMPILGQLPALTVLRLLGNSYTGDTMVCPSGSFKNLEVLKLWMLENLKKWEVTDGAMEKLKEVNIRRCSKLENFPSSLLKQKIFKELILNNMPPAFKENIDKNDRLKVSTKDF